MNKTISLLSILFLLLFISCKKDDLGPELPPITTIGANTFGCRVNGKVWVPDQRSGSILPMIEGGIKTRFIVGQGPEKNWYDLFFLSKKLTGEEFQIYISRINNVGYFSLNEVSIIWPSCPQCDSYGILSTNGNNYISKKSIESYVKITRYDTLNKVFSGEFSFIAVSKEKSDTIKITDGRFDIDQKVLN